MLLPNVEHAVLSITSGSMALCCPEGRQVLHRLFLPVLGVQRAVTSSVMTPAVILQWCLACHTLQACSETALATALQGSLSSTSTADFLDTSKLHFPVSKYMLHSGGCVQRAVTLSVMTLAVIVK